MSVCRLVAVVMAFVAMTALGCGGGSWLGPPTPVGSGPGGPQTVGTMQVETEAAGAFEVLQLSVPSNSPHAFTCFHGATFTLLQEIGHGKIAFQSTRDNSVADIFTMNVDGSDPVNLTDLAQIDEWPDWSPNGRKIAFGTRRHGYSEIYTMNADGSNQQRLTTNDVDDGGPDWSPNGERIAYHAWRPSGQEIFVMRAAGGGRRRLTDNSNNDGLPDWSPSGNKLAFWSDRDTDQEIYVMNTDGSGQANLTNDPSGDDCYPVWSPDGSRIAFASDRDGDWEVYVMNADGSGQTALTDHPANDRVPAWSMDGTQIAFASNRDGNWEVYAMNADGTGVRNLTNHGAADHVPVWCPSPSVRRSLIGAAGSDGGGDPPFGARRPLAVVAMSDSGLVSAATIVTPRRYWNAIEAESLDDVGQNLAGLRISAERIDKLLEDAGRGLPPRAWNFRASGPVGSTLVYFATRTGKIASAIVSAGDDGSGARTAGDVATHLSAAGVTLRGNLVGAYDTREPDRNRVDGPCREVVLDSVTGEVVSAS